MNEWNSVHFIGFDDRKREVMESIDLLKIDEKLPAANTRKITNAYGSAREGKPIQKVDCLFRVR